MAVALKMAQQASIALLVVLTVACSGSAGAAGAAEGGLKLSFEDNPTQAPAQPRDATNVRTIGFGSCNAKNFHTPQDQWGHMLSHKPELFIWLGDNVYVDRRTKIGLFRSSTMEAMQAKYQEQLQHPEYRKLLESTLVAATWDDHDYGINNGGKDFENKTLSQELFLNFVGEPADSARRSQPGVYTSYTFGTQAPIVTLIMLDGRFNRDDPKSPDPDRDMLGEEQWQWLQETLDASNSDVYIFGSGIQMLIEDRALGESWSHFPASRTRLLTMIAQLQRRLPHAQPFIISGDVHYAEMHWDCLSKYDTSPEAGSNPLPPIVEVTSSGMTHSWRTHGGDPYGEWLLNALFPPAATSTQLSPRHVNKNFAMIKLHVTGTDEDTGHAQGSIHLAVHHIDGKEALTFDLPLGQADWSKRPLVGRDCPTDANRRYNLYRAYAVVAVLAVILLPLLYFVLRLLWALAAALCCRKPKQQQHAKQQ